MSLLFALISETALVKESDLYIIARGVELGARDCALAWDKEPPAIDVFHARRALPDGCCPIVFLDDDSDPLALADHYWDPVRLLPAGRVWAPRALGLTLGSISLAVLTSHEVLEANVDPDCGQWVPCPGRRLGIKIAREVCDPVQSEYIVDTPNGPVSVANFVTPSYFDSRLADIGAANSYRADGGRFDFKGELTAAGQIGPDGYAILMDETHVWDEGPYGPFNAREHRADRAHRWARTERRHILGGVAA